MRFLNIFQQSTKSMALIWMPSAFLLLSFLQPCFFIVLPCRDAEWIVFVVNAFPYALKTLPLWTPSLLPHLDENFENTVAEVDENKNGCIKLRYGGNMEVTYTGPIDVLRLWMAVPWRLDWRAPAYERFCHYFWMLSELVYCSLLLCWATDFAKRRELALQMFAKVRWHAAVRMKQLAVTHVDIPRLAHGWKPLAIRSLQPEQLRIDGESTYENRTELSPHLPRDSCKRAQFQLTEQDMVWGARFITYW